MHQSILRLPDVQQRTKLSRSSIYNAIKDGTFPNSISLGKRAVGWISSDIDQWISSKIQVQKPIKPLLKRRSSLTIR